MLNKNLTNFFNLPDEKESKVSKDVAGGTFDLGNFQKDYESVQLNLKDLIQKWKYCFRKCP